jgi:hypothetical protein
MAADTAASVFGFLVRSYPTQSSSTDFGGGVPPTSGIASAMKRGYIGAKLDGAASAVKNGTVYVRTAGTGTVGGVEAAADGTNTFALANAYFTGPADASGNCEIAYNL